MFKYNIFIFDRVIISFNTWQDIIIWKSHSAYMQISTSMNSMFVITYTYWYNIYKTTNLTHVNTKYHPFLLPTILYNNQCSVIICSVIRGHTVTCFLPAVWCHDPTIYLKQTFPYTQRVNNYNTLVVEKDKDCFLACVVDKKPKKSPVSYIKIA